MSDPARTVLGMAPDVVTVALARMEALRAACSCALDLDGARCAYCQGVGDAAAVLAEVAAAEPVAP